MTRALAVLVLGASALGAAGPVTPTPSARIVREVGEAYSARALEQSPLLRLKYGLPLDRLPDISLAREEKDAAEARVLLARLDAVAPAELTHEETLSVEVLRRQLGALAEAPRFHWLGFPVTPYASPLDAVNQAFAAFPIPDAAAAEGYLTLLSQLPRLVGQVRETLEGQASRGIRIERDELDLVVPYLRSFVGSAERGPYAVGPERLKALSAEKALVFRERLGRTLDAQVNPPLASLAGWLDGPYREKAPATVGLSQYPGGREYYDWLVRWHTTMEVAPEAVHAIGLARTEALDAERARLRKTLGFTGTHLEFLASLRGDPRVFPRTPEEIGERLLAHARRAEPKLDAWFATRPRAPWGVKRLEPELEPAQTFGYYQIPTATDPTGYYRFNGSNLAERSLLNAAALIYHELIPGHHFQLALAFENDALPPFRRENFDTAYTEGWGEYASELAGEMGLYEDPLDLYGRLSMETFITVRLVVDTGMNGLGWSREKAEAFMRERLSETDAQIHTEALRYSCDIPGQALAYKMGAIRIRELREKTRVALGPRFDVRRFHVAVLGSGSLPLVLLERHLDWFVAQEKAR